MGSSRVRKTGESFTVGGMAVYRGRLYAGVSKPSGRGLYRYEGDQHWAYCGNPGHRVTNPIVFNGKLYLCSLDGGGIATLRRRCELDGCRKARGGLSNVRFCRVPWRPVCLELAQRRGIPIRRRSDLDELRTFG